MLNICWGFALGTKCMCVCGGRRPGRGHDSKFNRTRFEEQRGSLKCPETLFRTQAAHLCFMILVGRSPPPPPPPLPPPPSACSRGLAPALKYTPVHSAPVKLYKISILKTHTHTHTMARLAPSGERRRRRRVNRLLQLDAEAIYTRHACTHTCHTRTCTKNKTSTGDRMRACVCVCVCVGVGGFGPVQAVWLGRLWDEER